MTSEEAKALVGLMDARLRSLSVDGAYERWSERLNPKTANYDDFLFGLLVQAMFSGGMRGSTVDKAMPKLREACFSWNIEKVAGLTDGDLEEIKNRPGVIGNLPKLRAMRNNAREILEVRKSWASFSDFLASYADIDHLAKALCSKDSKYRFEFIGPVTVHDFLRNAGFSTIKPDIHVTRFLQRLGLLPEVTTERATIEAASLLAGRAGVRLSDLDALIYLFCGARPDVVRMTICGAKPLCSECPITRYCMAFANEAQECIH